MIMIGEERDAFNQASSGMVSMSRLRAYYIIVDVGMWISTTLSVGEELNEVRAQGLLITDWEAIKNIIIDTYKNSDQHQSLGFA